MYILKQKTWLIFVGLCLLVSLACNLPFAAAPTDLTKTPPTPLNATEIAQTVIAGLVTPVLTLTNTVTVTVTPTPTTVSATNTPSLVPSITQSQSACNQAGFLADVTIPDGAEIQTNTNFTKTWRLQNNGSCTWTSGYHVIFDSGDRMNAPDAVAVTGGTVAFGSSVDVS
ncbi:MAG TPA: NBR1-Ig-like domain-containing protein, partial [Leptolinea sp.]